jgi:hypothetical protein
MNARQKVVLLVGVLLLALDFTFPPTHYLRVRKHPSDDPSTGKLTLTPTTAPYPIWMALAQRQKEKAEQLKGHHSFETTIQWRLVFEAAAGIVFFSAWLIHLLRTKEEPPSRESPITQEGA